MKRRTKIALLIGCGLVVLGGVLTGLSALLGVNIGGLFMSGYFNIGTSAQLSGKNFENAYEPTGEYTASADGVTNLDINWPYGDVTVTVWDEDNVAFSEKSQANINESNALRWGVEYGTLYIQYCAPGKVNVESKDLTVWLPRTLSLGEIDVYSASGDVELNDILTREVDVETVSGDMRISCAADSVDAETVSGEVSITGDVRKLEAETVSGAVTVSAGACRDMDIETTSGDVALTLNESGGFTLKFDTVSGELRSDIALSVQGETYVSGNGSGSIKVDTVSGDLEIKK
jgi:DUF4097 and DUF4098 domain-containing protein YvlB